MFGYVRRLYWFVCLPTLLAQNPWTYSTYLGGVGSDDIFAVASDSTGATYIAGHTTSVGPPFSNEPAGRSPQSLVFLTKLDSAGRQVYSKVLGTGRVPKMVLDSRGNVIVAGELVFSRDFATPNAYKTDTVTVTTAYVAKFGPTGEKVFATYVGGREQPGITALGVDSKDNPVFCGYGFADLPVTADALFRDVRESGFSAYCSILSQEGSRLVYSTMLGTDGIPTSLAIGPGDTLWVGGGLISTAPLVRPYQSEDKRRGLFSPFSGEWSAVGDARFGAISSIQFLDDRVFLGTSKGAWLSPDRGLSWTHLSDWPGELAVSAPDGRYLCIRTPGSQLICSSDSGQSWSFQVFGGVTRVLADPQVEGGFFVGASSLTVPNYLPLGRFTNVRFPLPSPADWFSTDSSGDYILAIPYAQPGTVYRSTDHGQTMHRILNYVRIAVLAPSDPNVIYALRFPSQSGEGEFIRSSDGGETWVDVAPGRDFGSNVYGIIVDPRYPDAVYMIRYEGVLHSPDGGRTWNGWMPQGISNPLVRTLQWDVDGNPWAGTAEAQNGYLMQINLRDKTLESSTIFGGEGGGAISSIVPAESGGVIVTGFTAGPDLPANGDLTSTPRGASGFVSHFSAQGQLETLRYLGMTATGSTRGRDGRLHICTTTTVPSWREDAPIIRGRFGGGPSDALWLTLDPAANRITHAQWFGGAGGDQATAIHAGVDGRIRLVGTTTSTDLPVTPNAVQTRVQGTADAFIAIAPLP